ncbi:MAG: tetratricopeptide repeat protein [Candidatus Margulisiibacteriota bacterium]
MKDKEEWIDRIFLRSFRPYLWIMAVGLLLYFRALFFGFTYLDDNVVILDSQNALKNIFNIFHVFSQIIVPAFGDFYRPVAVIPYILGAQIGGSSPLVYHGINIACHLLAACLLFLFLVKLGYSRLLAYIFSLIFTVHPALAAVVVWIPGMVDALLTVLVLAAFIFFLDYLRTGRWSYYFWHLLFFALALLTKEPALILILLCPLYAYLVNKQKDSLPSLKFLAAGWFLISVVWFLLRRAILVKPVTLTMDYVFRSIFNPAAVTLYIGKIVLPFNLSPLPTLRDSSLAYGFMALVIICALLLFTKKKHYGLIVLGAVWFLLFLLPSLVFSDPSLYTGVALYEHRLYLPLIGFIILFLETGLVKIIGRDRKWALAIGAAIIILFSGLNIVHSDIFKDPLSFWRNAVKTSPHHPLARRNLGAMYYLNGQLAKAGKEYKKALELNPAEPMVHNNLGLIYLNQGKLAAAEVEFLEELKINPLYDNALFNLGLLYARQGRIGEAKGLWEKALKVNPEHIDARKYLRLLNGK